MLNKIKNKIERQIPGYIQNLNRAFGLSKIAPLLLRHISEFMLRDGKRLRPVLFILSYLGFAKKRAPGLYNSALSLELLHDFMLVHDDIIDKADIRRNGPSMHALLNSYLAKYQNIKFTGQDLALVLGDIMYAMSIHAFLSIKEKTDRKEKALRKLIESAVFTGGGEFLDLLLGIKELKNIRKSDIYKIYDFKTAYYTISMPLTCGAILAGADNREIAKISRLGVMLGRAFQIKDDILGIFGSERQIGKSILTDLRESKKTILIWYADRKSDKKTKAEIARILSQEKTRESDLFRMRQIMLSTGALSFAKNEISLLLKGSEKIISSLKMRPSYRETLRRYSREILNADKFTGSAFYIKG